MSKKYRIAEFAKIIGKAPSTVRRWDAEGILKAKRGLSNQRFYEESDINLALGSKIKAPIYVVVYCRVSSKWQADDLKTQVKAMQAFCLNQGLAVDQWIEEIGGGMNFQRKHFNEIMQRIERREINTLVIAHKDRLTRFGFEYFERFATLHGCKLLVANQEMLSPQQEMVEDLMTIVHTFSCRLYGLRNYKKQIKKLSLLPIGQKV